MLAVEKVNKTFVGARARVVLHEISLQLAAGQYIAIMGESGAGKSTLLNLIAGLDVPDSGRIVVAGQDMATLDDAGRTRLRRARMGFIFQAFHLLPHLSVARNVGLPLALNGAVSAAIAVRVEEILGAVGMYLSFGNTKMNPHVGLLFIDFEAGKRIRVNGTASLAPATAVEPAYQQAQFIVKVQVREVFPNCPRYIHKYQLVERSKFVPRADVPTPVPAWKRYEWAKDVLPEGDPAKE